jgi:hypothetical protein
MEQRIDTIKKLYDWSSEGYGNKGRISITCDALAALCAYATSIGVQAGHKQHADVMSGCRTKAKETRYYKMALSILPESDYLYDPRHSETDDFGDWESDLIIPEEK